MKEAHYFLTANDSISSKDFDCTTVCFIKISNLLDAFIIISELSKPFKSLYLLTPPKPAFFFVLLE